MAEVVVFGSYVMDLTCKAPHIPAVNETVLSGPFIMGPGGKGFNQAVAAALAGSDVAFITKIGKDLYNSFVRDAFAKFELGTDYLFEAKEAATGVALIVVDESGDNAIAVAPGACQLLTPEDVEHARSAFDGVKVLLTQFEADIKATETAMRLASDLEATVVCNPAPYCEVDVGFFEPIDILVPNEVECFYMTGIEVVDDATARTAANRLKMLAPTVVITLGDRGVFCPEVSDEIIPAMKVDTIDTTGAGDAFAGIFAAYLARDFGIDEAIEHAVAGAALSTTKFGTSPSMPSRAEIEAAG